MWWAEVRGQQHLQRQKLGRGDDPGTLSKLMLRGSAQRVFSCRASGALTVSPCGAHLASACVNEDCRMLSALRQLHGNVAASELIPSDLEVALADDHIRRAHSKKCITCMCIVATEFSTRTEKFSLKLESVFSTWIVPVDFAGSAASRARAIVAAESLDADELDSVLSSERDTLWPTRIAIAESLDPTPERCVLSSASTDDDECIAPDSCGCDDEDSDDEGQLAVNALVHALCFTPPKLKPVIFPGPLIPALARNPATRRALFEIVLPRVFTRWLCESEFWIRRAVRLSLRAGDVATATQLALAAESADVGLQLGPDEATACLESSRVSDRRAWDIISIGLVPGQPFPVVGTNVLRAAIKRDCPRLVRLLWFSAMGDWARKNALRSDDLVLYAIRKESLRVLFGDRSLRKGLMRPDKDRHGFAILALKTKVKRCLREVQGLDDEKKDGRGGGDG